MKCVGTFNGRKLYTDKNVSSINVMNDRVVFGDGSWVNLTTGAISNRGAGTISLDSPSGSSGASSAVPKDPFVQKRFVGKELSIKGTSARVNIQLSDTNEIVIDAVGLGEKDVDIQHADGRVRIQQTRGMQSGSGDINISAVSMGGSSFSHVSIGCINVGGSDSDSSEQLNIRVPKGTSLFLAGIKGSFTAGDIEGNLDLVAQGASKFRFGKMKAAELFLSGAASVDVDEVSGSLKVEASGSSSVAVDAGSVGHVSMQTSGAARAEFLGRARTGQLKASGASSIKVRTIDERPQQQTSGAASIRVRNW